MKISVTEVWWERILLHIRLSAEGEETCGSSWKNQATAYLAGHNQKDRFLMMREEDSDPETLSLVVNITNPGNCRCIPDGDYRLELCAAGEVLYPAAQCDLASARRRFRYNMQKDCCSIAFLEDPFIIRVKTQIGKRSALTSCRTKLSHQAVIAYYREERSRNKIRSGKDGRKRVLFLSEQSEYPGGNLTAVRDRMKERGLTGENGGYEILESYRDRGAGKKTLPAVIRKLALADYVFLDDHAPLLDYLVLDDSTVVVQLWHAGVGFKSSGYSRWGHPGCPAPFSCHRQYTWGVVSSRAVIPIFSEIWGINDSQVLPTGLPRIDRFLDPEHRRQAAEEAERAYPLIRGKKVILFAPTYRGKGKLDADYPYEKIDFEQLYETLGEDTVVLFRMHPWVKRPVPIPGNMKDRMADAAGTADINDLFYVSDLLITDYSSAICEYSLMDRPMLFYAFDEEEYASSRGFHRDYETNAPGRVCRSFDALLKAVREKDYEQEKAERYVKEQFDFRDTGSSDRVIDSVLLTQ